MLLPLVFTLAVAQTKPTKAGEAVLKRLIAAREMAPKQRAAESMAIARLIETTTTGDERVTVASMLVGSVTEGDLGKNTVQSAADTLSRALRNSPSPPDHGEPAYAYTLLAQVERYEGVRINLQDPQLQKALKEIDEAKSIRAKADFALTDLQGHVWKRSDLKGKVVLLNFWATWCPPCRKEMPDIQALYHQFQASGLIVLAVSDEDPAKVKEFAEKSKWTFPVLLDIGGTVGKLYRLESLPKTFVYDREGRLAATGIDMRSKEQLLQMLARAGLR